MNDIRVELQQQEAGRKVIYSKEAVDGRSISIDMGKGKTMDVEFTVNEDGIAEVAVSVTTADGTYQDFAVVRMAQDASGMETAIWDNPDTEDPTWVKTPFSDELRAASL